MVANANWLKLPPPNCICPLLVDYKVDETWNVSDFFLGWSGHVSRHVVSTLCIAMALQELSLTHLVYPIFASSHCYNITK